MRVAYVSRLSKCRTPPGTRETEDRRMQFTRLPPHYPVSGSEQYRSVSAPRLSDHDDRAEFYLSLFQVS